MVAVRESRSSGVEANLPASGDVYGSQPAAGELDTSQWAAVTRTSDGITYSYRYPPGWSDSLTYCAPGAATGESGHLPAGCVSTDFLVGQKARDVGRVGGAPLTVDGKSAERLIIDKPASVLVSQVYTIMVYGADGASLFGLSAQIGPNTDPSILSSITQSLDGVVGTLRVEVGR